MQPGPGGIPPLVQSEGTGSPISHLQKLHPTTLEELNVGRVIVDPALLAVATLASKCILCKQTLIEANKALGVRITFRKSQLLKGFAVSAPSSRTKGQRKDQPVCLECIKRHIGHVSASDLIISISTGAGSAETWFERSARAEPWRQVKVLLGEDVGALQAKEEEGQFAFSGLRASTAAEGALNKGRKVGEVARKPPAAGAPCATTSMDAHDAEGRLTIAAQAAKFLAGIRAGHCAMYHVGEDDSTSSVYLATTWDHNAARPKPLGRPSKGRALLETVHWDTMGAASCTCDRGRLFFGAPCVHKLALQALEGSRQASHISLQRGGRVVEAPCPRPGERVFGVYWNAASPSPQRTMVHFGIGEPFPWYCEGRKSGCSKTADCSHIQEVKRTLQRPDGVHRVSRCPFSEAQLERAVVSVHWWGGEMQVWARGAAAGGVPERCGTTAEGQSEDEGSSSGDAPPELEQYLLELVIGGHREATCKGEACFCKQHPSLFGGVNLEGGACASRCCSSASASGKRGRSEQVGGSAATAGRRGGKRRGKEFWAAKGGGAAEPVVVDDARSCKVEAGVCSDVCVGRRGDFLVPVCTSCACPSSECTHGASERVAVVLPMEAEGVQVEIPKLVRPVDSWEVHDPEIKLLRQAVRVSELAGRDFAELSELECLSAPCPRAPPPCKTAWIGL